MTETSIAQELDISNDQASRLVNRLRIEPNLHDCDGVLMLQTLVSLPLITALAQKLALAYINRRAGEARLLSS